MTNSVFWLSESNWTWAALMTIASVAVISSLSAMSAMIFHRSSTHRETITRISLFVCLLSPFVVFALTAGNVSLVSLHLSSINHAGSSTGFPFGKHRQQEQNDERFAAEVDERRIYRPDPAVQDEPAELVSHTGEQRKTELSAQAVSRTAFRVAQPLTLIAVCWGLGSLVILLATIRSIRLARRIRRQAQLVLQPRCQSIASAAAKSLGLAVVPPLVQTTSLPTPALIGVRNPIVALPCWIRDEATDAELRTILLHEFAHLRRKDIWTICAQALARMLYWPIISIHWLNRELTRSREEVCDNLVLAHTDELSYSELLLRLAKQTVASSPAFASIGIVEHKGELESRIARMLDPRSNRSVESPRAVRLGIWTLSLMLIGLLCTTRIATSQPTSSSVTTALDPRPRVDFVDDPLPDRAGFRLGTLRFNPPSHVSSIALSPDNKTLISVGTELIAWDTETGKERWRSENSNREFQLSTTYGSRPIAFSSDGSHFYTTANRDEFSVWATLSGERQIIPIHATSVQLHTESGKTSAVDVTPNGKWIAVGRAHNLVVCDSEGKSKFIIENPQIPDQQVDRDDRLAFGGRYIMGQFTPDGRQIIVTSSESPKTLRVFDIETESEVLKFELIANAVRFACSPDGKRLTVTERDNSIRCYDLATARRLWETTIDLRNIYENYTSAITISPDGQFAAVGATDNQIRILNTADGKVLGMLTGSHWYPWALAFTSDSKMLYSSGWDSCIRRWDVTSFKQVPPPQGIFGSPVVAASPDGKTVAYQDDAGTIRLISLGDGSERRQFARPDTWFSQILFSPDGRMMAAGGSTKQNVSVTIWNPESGQELHHWEWPLGRDPHSQVEALNFSPEGERIAVAVFRQSKAYVLDLNDHDRIVPLKHNEIYGLSFSSDGNTLATAGWDSKLRFWKTDDWTIDREKEFGNPKPNDGDSRMYAACFSSTGDLIAVAHMGGSVSVLRASDLTVQSTFVPGYFSYGSLAFSPDGLFLATGCAQHGKVDLWDAYTGTNVLNVGKHGFQAYCVGFGRDRRFLVSGADDNLAYVWDLRPESEAMAADPLDLWKQLSGDDAEKAYFAMSVLAETQDKTIALIKDKMKPVTSLIDSIAIDPSRTDEENERVRRMKRTLIEKDPTIQSMMTARRVVALAEQIETPASQELLREWSTQIANGPLSEMAANALQRIRIRTSNN